MRLITLLLSFLLISSAFATNLERWAVSPQSDLFENKVGTFIKNFSLKDSSGKSQSIYSEKTPLTVITIFDIDCPISLKLVPKVQRLEKEFPKLAFKHIFISKLASKEEAIKVYKSRKFTGQLLFDSNRTFANTFAVKTTCENYVIDSKGTLQYRGAIDDQYGINIVREKAENLYLKNALNNLMQEKPVDFALTGAPGCLVDTEQQVAKSGSITFHKDISRILQNKCQQCHRKGGVGPFELMTFDQAKERRKMIKYVVSKDIMPPWFADTGRKWRQNYDLSKGEKETLLKWLDAGTPEGDKSFAPEPKKWSTEGIIKNPDLIIKFPKVKVQAEGFMRYKYATVKVPITEDKWVRAVETRTKNPQVLHHALTFLTDNPKNKRVNAAAGFFSGYVPGATINQFPEGTGKFLPKGSYLLVQLHYTPNGTAVEDQVSLAFDFYDEVPKHEVVTKSAFTRSIKIPPRAAKHQILAEHKFREDGYLTGFNPHAHLRGKSFKYELIHADGKKVTLIDIPKYDFNWQINYQPVEPIFAPAGSKVKVIAHFDNSENNKSNPNPNVTVRFGEQTNDEMMIGYFEWYSQNSVGEKSNQNSLDALPPALKAHVELAIKKVKEGEMSKKQIKKYIMQAIQKDIRKGEYTREDVMQHIGLVQKEFQKL